MCHKALLRSGGVMEIRFSTKGLYSQTCSGFFCRTEKPCTSYHWKNIEPMTPTPAEKLETGFQDHQNDDPKVQKHSLSTLGKRGQQGKRKNLQGDFRVPITRDTREVSQ